MPEKSASGENSTLQPETTEQTDRRERTARSLASRLISLEGQLVETLVKERYQKALEKREELKREVKDCGVALVLGALNKAQEKAMSDLYEKFEWHKAQARNLKTIVTQGTGQVPIGGLHGLDRQYEDRVGKIPFEEINRVLSRQAEKAGDEVSSNAERVGGLLGDYLFNLLGDGYLACVNRAMGRVAEWQMEKPSGPEQT